MGANMYGSNFQMPNMTTKVALEIIQYEQLSDVLPANVCSAFLRSVFSFFHLCVHTTPLFFVL